MHCSFKVNLLQEQNIAATIARMEVASSRGWGRGDRPRGAPPAPPGDTADSRTALQKKRNRPAPKNKSGIAAHQRHIESIKAFARHDVLLLDQ